MASSSDSGVYQIRHLLTGRVYIGSAVSFKKRWREHERQLDAGIHHSKFLQRSWNKDGKESFAFERLVEVDRDALIPFEQAFIDAFRPEYNSAPRAGSQLGYRHTEETRARLRASRPKDFSPMTGKNHSEETKAKISANRKGKGGGYRSPERCAKIGAAHRGRPKSDEHRAKIATTPMGHKQSAEQIEKRMQKLRGRKMPPGFAEAASARMTGVKLPASHCLSIGKSKAKLTDAQVREIRERCANGERQAVLAREFGINQGSVSNLVARKSYAWVL